MFQGPDEDAHFDYAFSIYAAGKLLNVREKAPDPYRQERTSSPYVSYLEVRAGFDNIRHLGFVKAPPDYGTDSFYRSIDRGAPPLRTPGAWGPSQLVGSPFAYYLLTAVWMWAAHFFTGDNVHLFFAARVFSAVLLACSLVLTYGILQRLRVGRWQRLALTVVVGIFPLTSFVSSYVQPENLALTLVCACIYLALRLRDSPRSTATLATLGAAAGLLLVTKPQYWAGAVFAVILFLQGTWWLEVRAGIDRLRTLALLVVPSLVLQAVNEWVVLGKPARALPGSISTVGPTYAAFEAAVRAGPVHLVHYVATYVGLTLQSFYVDGVTLSSFWGSFGWIDTPLAIPDWVARVRLATTFVVAALVIVHLALHLRRAAVAAWHRNGIAVRRLIAANPLVSSYLAFTTLMVALVVLTAGSIGPQGRYWLQVLPGVFYTVAIWGPLAAGGRRLSATTSAVLLSMLLAYAAVGSVAALGAIQDRYYGHGRQVAPVDVAALVPGPAARGAITYVVSSNRNMFAAPPEYWPPYEQRVPAGGTLAVGGWAAGPGGGKPDSVFVLVDGTRRFQAVVGDDTPIAPGAPPPAAEAGFDIILVVPDLPSGEHTLTLAVVSGGRLSKVPGALVAFTVIPAAEVIR